VYVVAGVPFCILGGGGYVVAVCSFAVAVAVVVCSCFFVVAVGSWKNLLLIYCLQVRLDYPLIVV
jgi:hypothetical protein